MITRSSIIILTATLGFAGVLSSAVIWANNLFIPQNKAWLWPFVISLIVVSGTAFFLNYRGYLEIKSSDLFLLIFLPFFSGAGAGVLGFLGYIRWSDRQNFNQAQSAKYNPSEESLQWRARIENRTFFSKSLGVSFRYVSESQQYGEVTITEEVDSISIRFKNGKFGGAFKVFHKQPELSLIEFLKDKYSVNFPECLFYGLKFSGSESFEGNRFPTGYEQVARSGLSCPSLGIEIEKNRHIGTSFLMDSKIPNKYIYLVLDEYPIPAIKPTDQEPFPERWHETIEFLN